MSNLKLFLTLILLVFSACTPPKKDKGGGQDESISGQNNQFVPDKPKLLYKLLDSADLADDEVLFTPEAYAGGNKQFRYHPSTGNLSIKRLICPQKSVTKDYTSDEFVANYGFSPGRLSKKGKTLQLIVLGRDEYYKQLLDSGKKESSTVRVIGIMKLHKCKKVPCKKKKHWKPDWKVVAIDPKDPDYAGVKDINDLKQSTRNLLVNFWSTYKGPLIDDNKQYPLYKVTNFLGNKRALQLVSQDFPVADPSEIDKFITACHKRYKKTMKKKKTEPELKKKYLKCIERVHFEAFLPKHNSFSYFIKYTTMQFLLKLKEEDVTLDNALEKMYARQEEQKTYYRFVGKDLAAPLGLEQPIFEWIKMDKSTFNSCNDELHDRPLIDLQ